MTVLDPTKLSIQTGEHSFRSTARQILTGLYTFTTGNEYLTLGAALQIGTDPAGTPAANTLYKGNIPKAWIQFNMATDAIADSFNVSSITDGAAGVDTVVWDRDFADGNYAVAASGVEIGVSRVFVGFESPAAGSALLIARNTTPANVDATLVGAIAIGDQ